MKPFIVLFEDESAEDFRPLSWSLPLYELRVGLLSLRERLGLLGATEPPCGLLPRRLLLPLQRATLPPGTVAGVDACLAGVEAAGGALCLSARLGPCWPLLERLRAASVDEAQQWAWTDGEALLACRLGREAALAWLDQWAAWDGDTASAGFWTRGVGRAHPFRPLRHLPALPSRDVAPAGAGAPGCPPVLRHLWDVVPALGPALADDCARVVAAGRPLARSLFGIVPDPAFWGGDPPWGLGSAFSRREDAAPGTPGPAGEVWVADGARIDPGVVIDAQRGPVILDRDVRVQPFSYLQGPLYVGPGSLIRAGARIYGETSIGAVCRLAGEVGESLFLDFGNKQHDGFIGHAVLGSWVNLGAGTNCSDLKNNYGPVRVDYGLGAVDTGLRFLGLMMGEHGKSAIGTLFNTGTTVGFGANVFATGFPAKHLPNYTWGDPDGPPYAAAKAAGVARTVMARRGCLFTEAHAELFRALARAE